MASLRLTAACPDRVGLIAAVTRFIAEHGGWITEAAQHSDPTSGWFFMRYELRADSLPWDAQGLRAAFAPLAREYAMEWRVSDAGVPRRVVLMASREPHCLADLLYRWRSGELPFDLPCVIANHPDLAEYAAAYGVPFHHVPVGRSEIARREAFARVRELIDRAEADTVVLARYMQILPPALCEHYAGRIINIHHSFLPSFAGARPYHQAAERGVKLIGATCHYVTADLDAGPIIEQDVVRVQHDDSVDDLVRLGRDVEKSVLARGLRYHLEDRVLIHGNKTVVFS
ncbi:formyltetrahydrofolate deformylase [Ectothiorhodospiraceae bacterium 2226]|nr:formyltetrahydrofolate deformylase [Ectothiorhodospiraceae bacterium 2226]